MKLLLISFLVIYSLNGFSHGGCALGTAGDFEKAPSGGLASGASFSAGGGGTSSSSPATPSTNPTSSPSVAAPTLRAAAKAPTPNEILSQIYGNQVVPLKKKPTSRALATQQTEGKNISSNLLNEAAQQRKGQK